MSKIPTNIAKIYKKGNIIKRTYIANTYSHPYPLEQDIIKVVAVYSEDTHLYGKHAWISFDGYVYSSDIIGSYRSMYFTDEKYIKDELINYEDAVAMIL